MYMGGASPCHLHEDANGRHPLHDALHHGPFLHLEDLSSRFGIALDH